MSEPALPHPGGVSLSKQWRPHLKVTVVEALCAEIFCLLQFHSETGELPVAHGMKFSIPSHSI